MYRAGIESILGLRRAGATFAVDPCIPSAWPEYQIAWRVPRQRYEITVSNPERAAAGVRRGHAGRRAGRSRAIPLVNDGRGSRPWRSCSDWRAAARSVRARRGPGPPCSALVA